MTLAGSALWRQFGRDVPSFYSNETSIRPHDVAIQLTFEAGCMEITFVLIFISQYGCVCVAGELYIY